jgi:hypothetical protein
MKTFREYIQGNINESIVDKIDGLLLKFSKTIDDDNRTPKELLTQIKKLDDKALKSWYNGRTKIGNYTKLFQQAGVEKEMKKRGLLESSDINEKSELEKLIPLVKKSYKEIKDVTIQKVSGGEYLEVTFKNSEYRDELVKFMRDNLSGLEYDYDGTALLISMK